MFPSSKRNTQYVVRATYCVFLLSFLLLSACAPSATPTYFIPPTAPNSGPTSAVTGIAFSTSTPLTIDPSALPAVAGQAPNETSTPEEAPTLELPSPTPRCTNVLTFLEDVTIPDGTPLSAGEAFVKQWRVKNDGTCDWDDAYLLKLVSGDALGAPTEAALYPAHAGAEVIIEMNLTAPVDAGPYHTVWQAYAPDGTPFEQAIYVDFVVQ
jgi:hypothetical protein